MKSYQLNLNSPNYRTINKKTLVQDLPHNTMLIGIDKHNSGDAIHIQIGEDGRHMCNGSVCSNLHLDNDRYAYVPESSLSEEAVFEAKLRGDWSEVAIEAASLYYRVY